MFVCVFPCWFAFSFCKTEANSVQIVHICTSPVEPNQACLLNVTLKPGCAACCLQDLDELAFIPSESVNVCC